MPGACKSQKGTLRSSRTGAIEGGEPQCGCWKLNLIPLEDSQYSKPLSHLSSLLQFFSGVFKSKSQIILAHLKITSHFTLSLMFMYSTYKLA